MTTELKIRPFLSSLGFLLKIAAERGFDHVIVDKRDLGEIRGVGFVDAEGGRHGILLRECDRKAWESILKPVKEPT